MRIMGLDVGEKRIGIAVSDLMGWTAQPHSVLVRRNLQADLEEIKKICTELEAEEIIVGMPRNMNGSLGPKAREIQDFAQKLQSFLKLPVGFWDERLSTVSAERILIQADVSRLKRRKVIDKMAAATILQSYLDSKSTN